MVIVEHPLRVFFDTEAGDLDSRNSYGLALLTIVIGAFASALYTIGVFYIPIVVIGTIIPMTIAWFVIFAFHAALKGTRPFRFIIFALSIFANICTIWLTHFSLLWGAEIALEIFSFGPVVVIEQIMSLSYDLPLTFYSDAKAALTDSGLKISGPFLLALWTCEAVIFVASSYFGFVTAEEKQDEPSREQLGELAGNFRKDGLPVIGGVVLGLGKSLAQVALVVGAIYLISLALN